MMREKSRVSEGARYSETGDNPSRIMSTIQPHISTLGALRSDTLRCDESLYIESVIQYYLQLFHGCKRELLHMSPDLGSAPCFNRVPCVSPLSKSPTMSTSCPLLSLHPSSVLISIVQHLQRQNHNVSRKFWQAHIVQPFGMSCPLRRSRG